MIYNLLPGIIQKENSMIGEVFFYYCPKNTKMKIGPFLTWKEAYDSFEHSVVEEIKCIK